MLSSTAISFSHTNLCLTALAPDVPSFARLRIAKYASGSTTPSIITIEATVKRVATNSITLSTLNPNFAPPDLLAGF